VTYNATAPNTAPTNVIVNVSPATINENDIATVFGSFTDPDAGDTHTVVINWGDGSAYTTLNLAAGVLTYSAAHQYRDDNPTATRLDVYTIGCDVADSGALHRASIA
jgi:hypothetical protein